jgi:hypothetical protein
MRLPRLTRLTMFEKLLSVRPLGLVLAAFTIWFPSPLFAQTQPVKGSDVQVPFVGCEADGQVGAVAAPKKAEKVVKIDAGMAQRLAYYKAEYSPGVLAPRGWYCFGTYGSNGSSLFVSPQLIKRDD